MTAAAALIAVGLFATGYLLARSLALRSGTESGDACAVVFGTGCDATLGDGSTLLGIPLAGWGVVYYVTLASLLVSGAALGRLFRAEASLAAFLLASAGACVSLALAAVVASGRAAFCPLCFVAHAVNLLLVPALIGLAGETIGESLARLREAGRWIVGRESNPAPESSWKLVGFVNAALVAVVAYQWVFVESALRAVPADAASSDQLVAGFLAAPRRDLDLTEHDARIGPADAPAQLVVFSGFQCPGCRRLAEELRPLTTRYGDRLAVTFKHYPLSSACNPRMTADRHPLSCAAAVAAEAARRQGKFRPFHDALFPAAKPDGEAILRAAERAGLDLARFEADRRSPEAAAKVAADVALGTRLAIEATPAAFLDGRPVVPASGEALDVLIRHELEANTASNGG